MNPAQTNQREIIKTDFADIARYYLDQWRYHKIGWSAFRLLEFALIEGPGRDRLAAPYGKPGQIAEYWGMPVSEVYEAFEFCTVGRMIRKHGKKGSYAIQLRTHSDWVIPFRGGEIGHNEQRKIEAEIKRLGEQLDLSLLFELDSPLDEETIRAHLKFRFPENGIPEPQDFLENGKAETLEPARPNRSAAPDFPENGKPSLKEEDLKGEDSKLKALRSRDGKKAPGEEDFMELLRKLLPFDVAENDGGKWRMNYRRNPKKCYRVFNELKRAQKEGEIIERPGGYVQDLWTRWV